MTKWLPSPHCADFKLCMLLRPGVMHAGKQGGSNEPKKRRAKKRKKREKFWAALAPTLALHWGPRPICFVPGYLPLPSEGGGRVLGLWGPYQGHLGSLIPPPPHTPTLVLTTVLPLKCGAAALCVALMFALYPTCTAIIIRASWQSRRPSLLHLQLVASGPWHDSTVDLSSFT